MTHSALMNMDSAIQEPTAGTPEGVPPPLHRRMHHLNDIHLILASLSGNADAFTDLVQPHLHRFRSGIQRILQDDHDCQEALQAGLLAIHSELHACHGRTSFPSWAYRLCLEQALLLRRARERRKQESIEELMKRFYWEGHTSDQDCCPEWALGAQAFKEWKAEHFWTMVQNTLNHLSDDQRAVFILRDLDGMNTDEVARVLRLTRGLVRQHLHLARHRFRGVFTNPAEAGGNSQQQGRSMPEIDYRQHSN